MKKEFGSRLRDCTQNSKVFKKLKQEFHRKQRIKNIKPKRLIKRKGEKKNYKENKFSKSHKNPNHKGNSTLKDILKTELPKDPKIFEIIQNLEKDSRNFKRKVPHETNNIRITPNPESFSHERRDKGEPQKILNILIVALMPSSFQKLKIL